MKKLSLLLCLVPAVFPRAVALAQGASTAPASAAFLEQYAATYRFTLGRPTNVELTPDGGSVLFLRSGPRSFVRDLYVWEATTGKERLLLTADRILGGSAEKLSAEELARRERMRSAARGIASYGLSEDGKRILVPLSGRLFLIERLTGAVKELRAGSEDFLDPRLSPDGTKVALVHGGELRVLDAASGSELALSGGASGSVTHGLAEFVAQEEMDRYQGYWWSPDSRFIAYQRTDTAGLEEFHIADLKNPERPPRSWPYPRAGRKNADVRLGVVAASGGPTTWIEWDRARYPYLAKVVWEKNAPLTILVQNRAQTEEALLAVDAATGKTRRLLVEKDAAWLNLDPEMPHWLEDGKHFLWTSEESGAWRLELRAADGRRVKVLTDAKLNYRGFVDFDEARQEAVVLGGEDPTQEHLYRIFADGGSKPARRLSSEPGIHAAVFSKGHGTYVETFWGLSGARSQTVRSRDGKALGELRSAAEEPPFLPELELAEAGKERSFHAAIVRPRDFAPGRRYPVIVQVYGGPHYQSVRAARTGYLLHQWLADRGFIVVSIDGRGTPARGRAWERAIRGNFNRVPLEDQVAGLKALGERYPELDLSRVGIYGWSFGGYFSALAVMRRPDVFRAGVAGAPVCDWRDYDTHYTERYLGLPQENPAGYEDSGLLAHAPELTRPLLVVHGTTDDNVYFMHGLKLSDALFRAGRRHEFLPLAGFTHMVPDPLVTARLYAAIADFLERSLERK